MEFSAMTMNMFFPDRDDPADDHRIIDLAVMESIWLAELGFNPWYTDHHFRGPWHSNPLQFASYVVPHLPPERHVGFGVLSVPLYHPVRLVESMNLLDQLTKGRALFGIGSGWQGVEPEGLGVNKEYHASGRAAEDTLDVMEKLWSFRYGDPALEFRVGANSGLIQRRITPAPYSNPHPTIIRTASREASLIRAAHKGWPAFIGSLGANLHDQMQVYKSALEEANHPQHVMDRCLRWCSYDWIGVTIADTEDEAHEREQRCMAETMATRTRYFARYGNMSGPAVGQAPGKPTADAYAKGGDFAGTIAGTPDRIVAKVQQLADAGINHLHLRFLGERDGETRPISVESAELFAREVMPLFSGQGAQATRLAV